MISKECIMCRDLTEHQRGRQCRAMLEALPRASQLACAIIPNQHEGTEALTGQLQVLFWSMKRVEYRTCPKPSGGRCICAPMVFDIVYLQFGGLTVAREGIYATGPCRGHGTSARRSRLTSRTSRMNLHIQSVKTESGPNGCVRHSQQSVVFFKSNI